MLAYPHGMSASEWRAFIRFAGGVRKAGHKPQRYVFDDDGTLVKTMGGEYGNAQRAAYGYTQGEAKQVRAALRLVGITVSVDEAEGVLMEALAAWDNGERGGRQAMTQAQRTALMRAKARDRGDCGVCAVVPARAGMTTCADCSAKATERVKAMRARRREARELSA